MTVAAGLQKPTAGGSYDSLAVALALGLMLAAVVAALGHVSGAHVNPAVTIGLAVTGKFPRASVPAYLVAQFAGAILGSLAVWVTFGGAARTKLHLGATAPTAGVLIAGPSTVGAVNPARAIGPMIVSGHFTGLLDYVIGPVVGATLAALIYDRFLARGRTPG